MSVPRGSGESPTERSPLLGSTAPRPEEETSSLPGDERQNESSVPIPQDPSTGELLLVMSGTWLGSFLAALDSTIIATLTAPISASFNSLSLLSWLASSYFIATAALQPLSGRLTDIFSRRWGLVAGNLAFGVGNLLCGIAGSESVMILGRVVAGCGGGSLNAISTFVGSDLVPLRRRGVWQGFANIMFGVGAGLGAVLGGWINDVSSWRTAFLMLVPFTAVSTILVAWRVRIPVKQSDKSALKRVDFLGAFSLIVTLVLLLVGLNSGGNTVPWNHPLVYSSLAISALSLYAFIYIELHHASEPIIPVRLMVDRTVISACFTNWFATMAVFCILYYGPIYFQVKGLSTTAAGLRLAPLSIGVAVGSIVSGLIMRKTGRYYLLNGAIMALFAAACATVACFNLQSPLWLTLLSFHVAGIGYAGMLTVTLLALISAVDHEHQAVITSASYVFRSTGSAIGITIASAVFQNLLSRNLWAAIGQKQNAAEVVARLRDNLQLIHTLSEDLRVPVQEAYMESLRGVFVTTLGFSIIAGLISLLMKEHTLYTDLSRTGK